MSISCSLAFGGIAGAVYAPSQLILGGPLWSLLVVPAAIGLGGFVHGGIPIGQGLSADQMHVLRSLLERSLEDKTRSLQTSG